MFYRLKSLLREIYIQIRATLLRPFLFFRKTTVPIHDKVKSILFLRHDRIGDMVLSTGALKALRKGYPQARITVLASERNYQILRHNPNVDEILMYKGIPWFIKVIRPRKYDLVIDPFLTYEMKQAEMTYLAKGKYRIGFEQAGREVFFNIRGPLASPSKRMVDYLLDLADLAGGKKEGCEPEVFLNDTEIQGATEALADKRISVDEVTIAIHPGAYYPSQRWPAERFGQVARQILEQGVARVMLLGSRDEQALVDEVKKNAGDEIRAFSGIGIRGLMAFLSRCDLLVCNNSGPLHIASALKVPTVSMIGPTVTPLWLPYGENHVVINKSLPCSPCNRAVCKNHECMVSITVDEVFAAVKSQIAHISLKRKRKVTAKNKGRKLTES
jgi:lipopolysaccharide heptosyltransferase II